MRKNFWMTGGMLVASLLLISEIRAMVTDTAENISVAERADAEAKVAELPQLTEVKAAEIPQIAETVVIEDTQIPLSAAPVTEDSRDEEAQDKSVKSGQKETLQEEQQSRMQEETGAALEFPLTDLGNGVYGYVDEQAASALLTEVNGMREAAPALSGTLNDIAKRRALSCVKNFGHNGMEIAGECMARGQKTAAGAAASWKASAEHRMYIGDPSYAQAGTACLRYAQGDGSLQTIWVLVLN